MNDAPAWTWSETERLAALDSYRILDSAPEQCYDDVVRLVSQLFEAPIVAVNLLAQGRQWFKSEVGIGVREMPLEDAICKLAILEKEHLVIPDTAAEPRLADNKLVTGAPGLRFYAGVVLRTPEGIPLGTLCVLDTVARPEGATPLQMFALNTLAGQVMAQLTLHKTIYEQHKLLAAQRAIEQRLSEVDRRKTEFLATLAHELRNPLAPIRSGLGVMRLESASPAVVARVRDMMDRQVTHMVRLIDDLLDVARISGGKLSLKRAVVDLRSVLPAAVETSMPLIDGGRHVLSMNIVDQPLMANVDATRVVQVVANLLNNAAKYTPMGGRISLSAWREDDAVLVSVCDDGVGIPQEALDTVFEMFSQVSRNLDRAQDGLGIGLSLVRRLVDMHGGSVSATSAGAGSGCTFTVRLPAFVPAAPPVPEPRFPAHGSFTKLRILVADDNVDAAETLSTILELSGHTTYIAHDGLEALRMATELRPDAAVLDISMPGLSGYQVAQRVRASAGIGHMALIALTGLGSDEDQRLASQAGFDHHLTKPVQFDVITELLARATSERGSALA